MTGGKETFVERIFTKLFDSFSKDSRLALLVIVSMYSVFITIRHINYVESSNERIVVEVEKRVDDKVPTAVKKEVSQQIKPVSDALDTASDKLDAIVEEVIKDK